MTKTIVITGATGGLGKKAAEAFAGRGHSLVLLDRNQDRLDALTKDLNLPAERLLVSMLDLQDGEAVRATAEAAAAKFGGVHALIHLVGGWVGGKTLVEAMPKTWTLCSASTSGRRSICSRRSRRRWSNAAGDA